MWKNNSENTLLRIRCLILSYSILCPSMFFFHTVRAPWGRAQGNPEHGGTVTKDCKILTDMHVFGGILYKIFRTLLSGDFKGNPEIVTNGLVLVQPCLVPLVFPVFVHLKCPSGFWRESWKIWEVLNTSFRLFRVRWRRTQLKSSLPQCELELYTSISSYRWRYHAHISLSSSCWLWFSTSFSYVAQLFYLITKIKWEYDTQPEILKGGAYFLAYSTSIWH